MIEFNAAQLIMVSVFFGVTLLAIGYWFGHDAGVQAGFDAGWSSGLRQVRTLVARIREGGNGEV